ncbi:adenine deaminase [Paenibacillus humicus]|uniref:adenine deaminase n=1 Tax=Paenibacillus humicus TaxID=412861 RepID=UPI003F1513DB
MSAGKRTPLHEASRLLSRVARGEAEAEVVIRNGILVNVHTGELLEHVDVAIAAGRIAYVGDAEHAIGSGTQIIDAAGRYICPGLLDGHMHVESTMLSVTEFAKAALAKGTTGIFMDPHEIANVFGAEGVRLMHEEGQQLPLKVFTTFPSCVPATLDLEDAGARLGVEDISKGLAWDNVVGLGEVMNFPGVVYGDPVMLGEIEATIKSGKTVTGHFPSEDGRMLQAYLAAGVTSDHETATREQGLQKLRMGMHLMIREGSAWHDVKEVIKVVTEDKVPTGNISLVTDDVSPQTLMEKGHLNHVVRRAMEEGVEPVTAIQMATVNVARYFKCEQDLGSIAPGRCADILLLDDLERMTPSTVLADGVVVYDQGQLRKECFPAFVYPPHIRQSMHVGRELAAEDFRLASRFDSTAAHVHVIRIIENSARTAKAAAELPVENGVILPDIRQDTIRLACIERHHGKGQVSLGFVQGFGITRGAVASTVAHDSHNLLVMGVDEQEMAFAANELVKIGGGMIVVEDGKVLAQVPMAIAGLMSEKSLPEVVSEVAGLEEAWKAIGCSLNAPYMTFSLVALPVIPEIRITNRGLADVTQFKLIEVERDTADGDRAD